MMDIAQLAVRLGLPTRKIRYVFDQELMPASNDYSGGRGVSRQFFGEELKAIAIGALLLDAGIRKSVIQAALRTFARLVEVCLREKGPLLFYLAASREGSLTIGDGRFLRIKTTGIAKTASVDTGWIPLDDGDEASKNYSPLVATSVDWAMLHKITRE